MYQFSLRLTTAFFHLLFYSANFKGNFGLNKKGKIAFEFTLLKWMESIHLFHHVSSILESSPASHRSCASAPACHFRPAGIRCSPSSTVPMVESPNKLAYTNGTGSSHICRTYSTWQSTKARSFLKMFLKLWRLDLAPWTGGRHWSNMVQIYVICIIIIRNIYGANKQHRL